MILFCRRLAERKILQQTSATETSQIVDSDDSDDIIMSPSRPLRKRESLLSPLNSKDLI